MNLNLLEDQMNKVINELLQSANLEKGDAIILGGSTSEIIGEDLGSATNMNVAETVVNVFKRITEENELFPIIQSCEHINRALVVEREYAEKYDLMPINVLPIADVFIGMHLDHDRVGVVVKSKVNKIGHANLSMIRTRARLIGGDRSKHF